MNSGSHITPAKQRVMDRGRAAICIGYTEWRMLMLKRILVFMGMAAMSIVFANAQSTKLTIPVTPTPADDGKQMYVIYCARCHGLDGRGQGPAASALKLAPTDLTLLSKNNKGIYPATHVASVLKYGSHNSSSESKAMPVWGPALESIDHPIRGTHDTQALRIANLVKYVKTLQAK
jgi:mono/diheme cytochrome c family protein